MPQRSVYLALATLFLNRAMLQAQAIGPIAGPNVNMVSGREWPKGDPFLQRQNEPSMAVSTRNPLHVLAGANDYRSVDLPQVPDTLPNTTLAADGWVGVFKSFDGAQTWISDLHPGYSQDASAEGTASPLKGFSTASDVTVRAGTNGLFYYSGIAFNRGANGLGVLFISRFSDYNNKENGDTIRRNGTFVIDSGTAGKFIDKPALAVDIPRAGAQMCNIPAGGAPADPANFPAQSFPGGNVYVSYADFVGSDQQFRSKLLFARSTDCGATWSQPSKISEGFAVVQGSAIAIDPRNGNVYVVFRQFPVNANDVNSLLISKSTDGGQTFTKPTIVGPVGFNYAPFDENTTATTFRTEGFPAIAVDTNGRVYVAWSQRGPAAAPDARIYVSSSADGVTWSMPAAADPNAGPPTPSDPFAGRGHQIMPALAFNAGRLALVYYDLRLDHRVGYLLCPVGTFSILQCTELFQFAGELQVAGGGSSVFTPQVDDAGLTMRRHTIDVRMAESGPLDPNAPAQPLTFNPSVAVSQYVYGTVNTPQGTQIQALQANVPDLPLFQQGFVPFLGDYIDVAGSPMFVPTVDPVTRLESWRYNTAPSVSPLFHAVWTDNRDVAPPLDGNWQHYTPPTWTAGGINCPPGASGCASTLDPAQTRPACVVGQAGMRNQNIYTSRVSSGLIVGAPFNQKPLGNTLVTGAPRLLQRAFSVFAINTTAQDRTFQFAITSGQPVGGKASFDQLALIPVTSILVPIPARSGVARAVFVTSSDPNATVTVDIFESSGATPLRGTVLLNPSITNPSITNPSITNPSITNPSITNAEVYNPSITNPSITNPSITNPSITNPSITNPSITNPSITNDLIYNPSITNPSITNPSITNPSITNPSITNPSITNTDLTNGSVTDATWTVTNQGNTAGSYNVKMLLRMVPNGIKLQLVTFKIYTAPTTAGCDPKDQRYNVVFANIANPDTNPATSDATIPLAPGESAYVTLRVIDSDISDANVFNPVTDATAVIESQAVNTIDLINGIFVPPSAGGVLTFINSAAPDGAVGIPYSFTPLVSGGTYPLIFNFYGTLPPGVSVNAANGALTGTPGASGNFAGYYIVQDSSTPTQYALGIVTFTINPASGPFLAFTQQPGNMTAGTAGAPVKVRAQDAGGGFVPGIPVTLFLSSNPNGAVLGGGSAVTDPTGVATFPALTLDRGGSGYTLTASSSGFFSAASTPFNVAGSSLAAPMTFARSQAAGVMLVTGKVLMFGGLGAAGTSLNVAEMYDPTTNTWTNGNPGGSGGYSDFSTVLMLPLGVVLISGGQDAGANILATQQRLFIGGVPGLLIAPNLKKPRRYHTATILTDGRILITGGETAPGVLAGDAELLDAQGTPIGAVTIPMVTGRMHHTATLLPNGKVLIVGGTDTVTSILNAEIFDPVANTFAAAGSATGAHIGHTATVLPNGNVLIAGAPVLGLTMGADLYNSGSGSFTALGPIPARLSHTAALLPDGRVLLAGGDNAPGDVNTTTLFDYRTNSFSSGPNIAAARHDLTGVLMPNGKFLIAGGRTLLGGADVALSEFFQTVDPPYIAASLGSTGAMNVTRVGHTETMLPNGKVLIAGGISSNVTQITAEVYDPVSNTFTPTGFMTAARAFHTATLLGSGLVLLAGGGSNSAELFNPATNTFASTGPMTSGRSKHQATLLYNGKVLITGGRNTLGSNPALNSVELYDPATGAFTLLGVTMNAARESHTATTVGGGVVVIGGGNSGDSIGGYTPLASIEAYDPLAGTFGLYIPTLSIPRAGHFASLVMSPGPKVLFSGGNTPASATADLFDIVAGTVTTIPLTQARSQHGGLTLFNGKVLLVGGTNGAVSNATTEIFNPATNNFTPSIGLTTPSGSPRVVALPDGRVLITDQNGGKLYSPGQ